MDLSINFSGTTPYEVILHILYYMRVELPAIGPALPTAERNHNLTLLCNIVILSCLGVSEAYNGAAEIL